MAGCSIDERPQTEPAGSGRSYPFGVDRNSYYLVGVFLAILIGFGTLLHLTGSQLVLGAWAILAVIFVWQFLAGHLFKEEYRFSGKPLSMSEWTMIRMSGSSFAVFLFDPAAAGAFVTVLTALFLSAPRMLQLAVGLVQRAQVLQRLDRSTTLRILSTMMKGESRLSLDEIRERFSPPSMTELIGGLTALDGFVLIGTDTDSPSLTVAPRLTEDYKDWLAARRERQAAL